MNSNLRKYLGVGFGALVLSGATATLCYQALAQGEGAQQQQRRPGNQRPQVPGQPGEPQDGFGGGFGGPGGGPGGGFGGPGGGFGGPGGGPGMGMGMMMGGGASMTANATTVFVMRGNQLMAFDASTLRLKAQAELPMPQGPGGGFGGPGGGRGGFGGGEGGGRPQRPGGNQ